MGAKKIVKNPAHHRSPAQGTEGAPRTIGWLIPAVIAAVTFFVFLPVLQNGFLVWDDEEVLLKNLHYRGLGWTEIRWIFTTFHAGHYQPLSWMTFGLDYILWGMEPSGYHLTNLLFHAANAVLFYFLALRLLTFALSSSETNRETQTLRAAAGAATLFFSLHPLRAESVAWVTERRDVVSAFFLLGALLCYLRATDAGRPQRNRSGWLAGALLTYAFSLLSKGAGMTFPLVLVVLDIYPLKRLGGGRGKWFDPEARRVWWEKAPFLALGLAAAFIAAAAQYQSGAMLSMERHGAISRLAQAIFGLAFYLWKTVVPLDLSPLHEIPTQVRLWDWPFPLSGVVVLAISAGLIAARRRWPAGLAAWACYAAILVPTLGIAQSGPQLVADRYSYLSCMGWAVLAGAGLHRFWRLSQVQQSARPMFLTVTGLLAVALAGLAVLTWKQVQVWHDTETLWRYAVGVRPESSIAHYNLALLVGSQGKLDEAVEHYRHAVRINPRYVRARNNLGVALAAQGRLEEAMEHYRRALELDPDSAEAHNNLGNAHSRRGELDDAMRHYREALRIDPTYVRAHNGLGIALAKQGNLEEAIARFRVALDIDPAHARVHLNLGNVLAGRGELEGAAAHYRRALESEPGLAAAHEALGRVLALQGKRAEAVEQMEKALEILKSRAQEGS